MVANDLLQRVISTEPYLSSRSLSIYLSMPHSEVQTLALVQHALGQDKIVWVPFIPKGGRMTMVRLYKDDGEAEWERDGWGIPVVGRERREHLGPRDDGALLYSLTLFCAGSNSVSR
jgi:5-formyltetrahydrofolate cyclo-ligase